MGGLSVASGLAEVNADGVCYLLGLDLSGAVSATAAINAALARADVHTVCLPATGPGQFISASPSVPSGKQLAGAGMKVWDRVSAWIGYGTLLVGTVIMTGSVNATLADLSVDAYALGTDGVDGKTDATAGSRVRRVATRANNHGQLWEKNANTGVVATDKIGATFNDILVEDCVHYGGPNGFISKMNGVRFKRCIAYDVTSQAFAAVSDNINLAATYSRARNTVFEDCYGFNCGTNVHIYSRDTKTTNNANGVLGADNITVIGGNLSGATTGYGVQVGDASSLDATQTRIANINVVIDGVTITDCSSNGIIVLCADGLVYKNCYFARNAIASGLSTNVNVSNAANLIKNVVNGGGNIFETESTPAFGCETGVKAFQASAALNSGHKGLTCTNYLTTAQVVFTLPTPRMGDVYEFLVTDADGIRVASAVPGTNFLWENGASIASYTESTTRGSKLRVTANQSQSGNLYWYVEKTGTWVNV